MKLSSAVKSDYLVVQTVGSYLSIHELGNISSKREWMERVISRSSTLLKNRILWDLLTFLPYVSVWPLIIFNYSELFIIKEVWTSHTYGKHVTPNCHFFAVQLLLLNFS